MILFMIVARTVRVPAWGKSWGRAPRRGIYRRAPTLALLGSIILYYRLKGQKALVMSAIATIRDYAGASCGSISSTVAPWRTTFYDRAYRVLVRFAKKSCQSGGGKIINY
jgi:hypothetical protein